MNDSRLCIVLFPFPTISIIEIFLNDLIRIFTPQCKKLSILGSGFPKDLVENYPNVEFRDIKISLHYRYEPIWWSTLLQIFKVLMIQLKMSLFIFKNSKNTDIIFYYMGGAYLFFPILISKILKKRIIIAVTGRDSLATGKNPKFYESHRFYEDNISSRILFGLITVIEDFIFYMADVIVVESPRKVSSLKLERYSHKIFTEAARFVDVNKFKITKKWDNREYIVGYIGRLSEIKGIRNFVKAIKYLKNTNIKFFIGGKGPLHDWVIRELNDYRNVEIREWIPHHEVPKILNEFKLFILPSYMEGLPTIVLEAMACGTPVLATEVGGMADVIKDKKTGFILKDNSPKSIARNITRALDYRKMENIVKNARKKIEMEYTFSASEKRYKSLLKFVNESG